MGHPVGLFWEKQEVYLASLRPTLPPSYCGMVPPRHPRSPLCPSLLHLPPSCHIIISSLARSFVSSSSFIFGDIFYSRCNDGRRRRERRTKRATREHECADDNDDDAMGSLSPSHLLCIFRQRPGSSNNAYSAQFSCICTPIY